MGTRRRGVIGEPVRRVKPEEGSAGIERVISLLEQSREALAALMLMENARHDCIHEDDDYIRRMMGSLRRKKATMERMIG